MKFPLAITPLLIASLLCVLGTSCTAQQEPDKLYDKSYALVIGITHYNNSNSFIDLPNADKDAFAVAEYLQKTGFDVIPLYNKQATREAIHQALAGTKGLRAKVGENDRVVIFFAGHGDASSEHGKYMGYIIPWDAETNDVTTYITMGELKIWGLDQLSKVKHLVFILDSCYGGTISPDSHLSGITSWEYMSSSGGPESAPSQGEVSRTARREDNTEPKPQNYLHRITTLRARESLTAGGKNQRVMDGHGGHSLFTGRLLSALRDGSVSSSPEGYITFSKLWAYIQQFASNNMQTPQASKLEGDEGGDFVFNSLSPQRRVGIMPVFEPVKSLLEQDDWLQHIGADLLASALQNQMGNGRVFNVTFTIAPNRLGIADIHQISRGLQKSPALIENDSSVYDYQLQVKYSLLGNKRARVAVEFKKMAANLPEIQAVAEEISTNEMNFDQVAREILQRFVPEADLHLHLEEMRCQECPDDIRTGVQSLVESWLSQFSLPRTKYVKEEDNDSIADVRLRPSMWIAKKDNRDVFKANIIVSHAGSKTFGTFTAESDPAKWKDALRELQEKATNFISDLLKKF